MDASTKYKWSAANGVLHGYNVVGTKQLNGAVKGFVALMSFDRGQLYDTYDNTKAQALAFVFVSLLLVGIAGAKAMAKISYTPRPQHRFNKEVPSTSFACLKYRFLVF